MALFVRELRRLAPYALGSLALGAAVALFAVLSTALVSVRFEGIAPGSFYVVAVAAPLLLGIATAAPEVESGAAFFLAVLPIARRRLLAVRWGAALALLVATNLVALGAAAPFVGRHALLELSSTSALVGAVGFIAAAASSVAVRRTLLALVLAPIFGFVPFLAHVLVFETWLHAGKGLVQVVLVAGLASLVVGAILAHLHGDVHAKGERALRAVLGVVLGTTLLLTGGASAVHAYEELRAPWLPAWVGDSISRDGRALCLTEARARTFERPRDVRVSIVDLDSCRTEFTCAPEEQPLARSPDGAALVTVLWEGTRERLFLRRRGAAHAERLELAYSDAERRPHDPVRAGGPRASLIVTGPGLGAYLYVGPEMAWHPSRAPFAWKGGEPFAVTPGTFLAGPRGQRIELPSDTVRVASIRGSRLLLESSSGVRRLLDIETGAISEEVLASLPAGLRCREAALAEPDTLVVLAEEGAGAWRVVVLDLARRVPHVLPITGSLDRMESAPPSRVSVALAPGGRWALVHWDSVLPGKRPRSVRWRTQRAAIEVATGRRLDLPPAQVNSWLADSAWSPDQTRVLLKEGIVELTSPGPAAVVTSPPPGAAAFLGDGRLLCAQAAGIVVVDPASGRATPFEQRP